MMRAKLWPLMAWVMCLGLFGAPTGMAVAHDFLVNGQAVGKSPLDHLTVTEGLANRAVLGHLTAVEATASQTKASWRAEDGTVEARLLATNREQGHTYRLTLSTSEKGKMRLLRVALTVPAVRASAARFWDGYEERPWSPAAGALERSNPDYTFPLACANDDQRGMAVGITPETIVSTLHCGVRRVNDRNEIFYETRLVVDADDPQTITFVSYPFRPTFGYLDAVQDYYRMFPAAFRPVDGVDDRIYGVGGYIISSYRTARLQLNSVRRAKTNWEWSYAPWVRSGDWYPEKNQWIEGTDVIRHYESYRQAKKGTWQEYHDARVRQFVQGDKTSAMFYYLLVKDINRRIVERYPASRMVTKGELSSGRRLPGGGMGALEGEDTLLTSAYGTGLAAKLEEDIRKAAENYSISGFAFDMANHAIDDYGEGQRQCGVGRTFDDQGLIYSPDTISATLLAKRIHKLSYRGKTMGVIMNQAIFRSACFPVFQADGVMYESLPNHNPDNVMPLRLMSGRKPMTFWGNIDGGHLNTAIRWEYAANPEAANNIRDGLAQHALFTCLKIGATPMNWAVPSLGRSWMPTLIQLKRLGWNPVPAVISSSPDLWIGRFGAETQTILTVSNPKRCRIQADLVVLSRYLGASSPLKKGTGSELNSDKSAKKNGREVPVPLFQRAASAYAFVSEQGQVLGQTVHPEKTSFTVDLAPKEIMVLHAVALDLPPGNGSEPAHVAITSQRFSENGRVALTVATSSAAPITISGQTDGYPGKHLVDVSGPGVGDRIKLGQGRFQITLSDKGPRRVRLAYEDATRLAGDKQAMLRFFSEREVQGGNAPLAIVVPDGASPADQAAAEMLESYYANLQAYRASPNDLEPGAMNAQWDTALRIPIVCRSKVPPQVNKCIYVGTRAELPRLAALWKETTASAPRDLSGGFVKLMSCDNRPVLWIGGRTAAEVEAAAAVYLGLMDSTCLPAPKR